MEIVILGAAIYVGVGLFAHAMMLAYLKNVEPEILEDMSWKESLVIGCVFTASWLYLLIAFLINLKKDGSNTEI